ncbi:MAG: glycosyltransferase family 39 protein [Acidobacteria bacterium]|nr:glycosyltransferase family 39 protein [Acidobacteriota bacterium]
MTVLDRISTGWKAWIILFLLTFGAAAPGVFLLPALDRDESRFAQASKEMLEENNYILIQYQDELRNKKPAGIHWLQAASTAIFTGPEAKQIWTYRVPSWLGAAFATLACFWAGIPLIGRRAAFLGAAMFGATLLLTSEAHISKTDGVLVFLTTLGIGALGRLYLGTEKPGRMALLVWLTVSASFLIKGPVTMMVVAYAGLGAWAWDRARGAPRTNWWRPLTDWKGPALFVAMVLPWFLWIQAATNGQYIEGAVGKDLKDKFTGASEGHGGWPFYHLTHIPAWFFPATLLVIAGFAASLRKVAGPGGFRSAPFRRYSLAAIGLFALLLALNFVLSLVPPFAPGSVAETLRSLKLLPAWPFAFIALTVWLAGRAPATHTAPLSDEDKGLRLILAWGLLTYAFFELMPTLLSHYILPAYPAFGLLCGYGAARLLDGARLPVSNALGMVLFVIGAGLLLAASFPGVTTWFMAETAGDFRTVSAGEVLASWTPYRDYPLVLWWAGFVLAGLALVELARRHVSVAIGLAILSSVALGWHIRIFMLPSQVWVQPTETARLALEDVCGVPGEGALCNVPAPERVLALGYAEPSYILTLGTQNAHPPETPLDLPADAAAYPVVYLLNFEDRKADEPITETAARLRAEAERLGACLTESPSYYALNYSNGDPVHFRAWRFDWGGCP